MQNIRIPLYYVGTYIGERKQLVTRVPSGKLDLHSLPQEERRRKRAANSVSSLSVARAVSYYLQIMGEGFKLLLLERERERERETVSKRAAAATIL